MTDKYDDGGPAFPIWNDSDFPGATLRDYFAVKAMQGMVSSSAYESGDWEQGSIAEQAYQMADAMIAERNKRRGE